MKCEKKHYFTVNEFMEAVMEQVKADPKYQDAEKRCVLDYDMPATMTKYDELELCSFDVVGQVAYGGNEGIYGDVQLLGCWKHGQQEQNAFRGRMNVYTLKTLETNKDAYLAMGELVTLICYYANEYVGAHMDRFD